MNEKPNFIDNGDLPMPLSPELESYKKKIFESNPEALQKKEELLTLLNSNSFDLSFFRKQIEEFNEQIRKTKGHEGQYSSIETIRANNGKLIIYHFRNSNSIKFGYSDVIR